MHTSSEKIESKSLAVSFRNIYETFAICWPTVVDAALGRVVKETCDDRLAGWGIKLVEHAKIKVSVVGRENMRPGETYLVMSNHQSLYDVPVLFYVIGGTIRMITKKELFKVPIFGGAMREAGFVSIDRQDRNRAIESLAVARDKLAKGVHIWIAPEGTRSKTGALLPFKKGGFALALDAKLPVLPVTLNGTRDALPNKGLRSIPGAQVTVTMHPPIDPNAYAGLSTKQAREKMMGDVRVAIQSALP
jgi:1-acyl-sn-glycerol-3-phosphate acyltransferase